MNYEKEGISGKILKFIGSLQIMIVFILMFLLLSIFVPRFFSAGNLLNLPKQFALNLVLATTMTILIISGEFDISVGAVLCLSGFCSLFAMNAYGIFAGVVAALAAGFCAGLINGIITIKGNVPSFIATLGMMMTCRVLSYVVSGGFSNVIRDKSFAALSQGDILGIPNLLFIVIIAYALMFTLLHRTKFGQYIFAVGSNKTAAALSGINVDRIKIAAFSLNGLMAGFGALLTNSRVMAIHPDSGTGIEFEVIAGVVIGGTSIYGGEGNVLLSIAGVLVVGFIRNALNLTRVDVLWNQVITGVVILAAVLIDSLRRSIQRRLEERAYMK